jgi:hypothetical protein
MTVILRLGGRKSLQENADNVIVRFVLLHRRNAIFIQNMAPLEVFNLLARRRGRRTIFVQAGVSGRFVGAERREFQRTFLGPIYQPMCICVWKFQLGEHVQ